MASQLQASNENMSAKLSSMQEDMRNLRTANRKLSKQHSAASLLKSLPPPPRRGSRESLIGASQDQRSYRVTVEHPLSASAETVPLRVLCNNPLHCIHRGSYRKIQYHLGLMLMLEWRVSCIELLLLGKREAAFTWCRII